MTEGSVGSIPAGEGQPSLINESIMRDRRRACSRINASFKMSVQIFLKWSRDTLIPGSPFIIIYLLRCNPNSVGTHPGGVDQEMMRPVAYAVWSRNPSAFVVLDTCSKTMLFVRCLFFLSRFLFLNCPLYSPCPTDLLCPRKRLQQENENGIFRLILQKEISFTLESHLSKQELDICFFFPPSPLSPPPHAFDLCLT